MGKMTLEIIEQLYMEAKGVFYKTKSMKQAINFLVARYDPSVISKSSSVSYIRLYNDLLSGKKLSWNINTELLVYYVDHIFIDEGKEKGEQAYRGAMNFAEIKSRKVLIDSLNVVKEKYELYEETIMKEISFEVFYKKFKNIIDSRNSGSKSSHMGVEETGAYNEWMASQNGARISAVQIKHKDIIYGKIEAKSAFVELFINLCNQTGNYEKLKSIGYFFDKAKIIGNKNWLTKYVQVGAEDLFIHADCNVFVYMEKCVKLVLDLSMENELSDYSFAYRIDTAIDNYQTASRDNGIHSNVNEEGESRQSDISKKEILQSIHDFINSKGFIFEMELLNNFYLSLKSKPFVILAGISGTGKSKLVELFAEACGADEKSGRYLLVPVRPDWSDSSDLLGHVDLYGKFIEGAIIEFIKRASTELNKPFFLCLDEMNLARVEYYFSDFLSVIETRKRSADGSIHTKAIISSKACADKADEYGDLEIPENLYVVGTVNMDETTFPFSRKVLDRANTIEFSDVNLIPQNYGVKSAIAPLNVDNSFLKTDYLQLPTDESEKDYVFSVCNKLEDINKELKKANAQVAYRVRDELVAYMVANKNEHLLDENEAWDNQIMQKILPRLQGSNLSVKKALCGLFGICATKNYEGHDEPSRGDIADSMDNAIDNTAGYPISAKKIANMVRRYEEDGFTSFWA